MPAAADDDDEDDDDDDDRPKARIHDQSKKTTEPTMMVTRVMVMVRMVILVAIRKRMVVSAWR